MAHLKFNRVLAVAFLGAGKTNEEARANQIRRVRQYADDLEAGNPNIDVGSQVLADLDPGGGGPCRPDKLDVAEVILVVPLPEAQSRDDDDD